MKLTKKLEAEILKVYNAYWDNYLKGDAQAIPPLLDDNYTQFGSAEGEVFYHKKDALQFIHDTIDQVAGKLEMRKRATKLEQQDNAILILEQCDLYVLADGDWIFYSRFRASTLMQEKQEGWKIIHQHSSFPDTKAEEGQNIAIDKIAEENLMLREAIKRRTVELENRNKDLEIEASLERIRTVAMGMRKADDLLNICKIMFQELQSLGFNQLRNTLIHTFVDEQDYFIDYDYSDSFGGKITRIPYSGNPLIERFIKEIRKSNDAFTELVVTGTELDEWREFRKAGGQIDDPRLNNASSVYYYYYSIEAGDVGVSAFSPISENQITILKRFRNVFDFAYRRYTDIEKAEAQAREAKIEAALEKIRSRSMAMQSPQELKEVALELRNQLGLLEQPELEVCAIQLYEESPDYFEAWAAVRAPGDRGKIIQVQAQFPRKGIKIVDEMFLQYEMGTKDYVLLNEGEKVPEWLNVLKECVPKGYEMVMQSLKGVRPEDTRAYWSMADFEGGSLVMTTYIPPNEEARKLLRRFANVFGLAYRRFIDLKKAEAQAKEAQIELALERVRAKTMAMQHSDELQDAAILLFQQMKALGVQTGSCGFNIWDKEEKATTVWMSSAEGGLQTPFTLPHTESAIYMEAYDAMKKGDSFLVKELGRKDLKKHFDYLLTLPGIGDVIKKLRETGYLFPEKIVYHFAFFSKGYLSFHLNEHHPETEDIFKRFGKVFDQTYTRFLDLQKAEAQAREAQIEAGLERVRSRTMAMQKTDELLDAAELVHKELSSLGINSMNVSYAFVDEDEKHGSYYSINPVDGRIVPIPFIFPHTETEVMRTILSSWKKQESFKVIELTEKETLNHQTYIGEHIQQQLAKNSIPFSVEEFLTISPKKAVLSTFNFSKGYLFNIGGERLSKTQEELVLRFTRVFEQTYTRFLDLQKAEAQAREAQIEAALERVRTKTMAMQKSDELAEAASLLFHQVKVLGIDVYTAGFTIWDEESENLISWACNADGSMNPPFPMPYKENDWHNRQYKSWKNGEDFITERP